MAQFLVSDSSAEKILRLIRTKKDAFWSRERERRPLQLFHEVARRVPAYKDFLRKNKINPAKIRTFKDFQLVPPVSKKTYLREYPLKQLVWDGTLKKHLVYTSTSGSTGEPFYFPRGEQLDWEYSILAELFLEHSSYGARGPTLVVVGLGMGVWIGGLISYKAFEIASRRGKHEISIITPGINKKEIFHALRNLAPHYKETILIGYPPFVKDVVDEAGGQGINLKKLNMRILTAAEAYTENFRDYLAKKAGIKNLYRDMSNIYGTADIGAMAWETPTAILMRRLAMHRQEFFERLFSPIRKTPTLTQYNPFFVTFEAPGGDIFLSGNNTIPLVRYAIGDHGGAFSFREATTSLESFDISLVKEARAIGIENYLYELPFVYVYERKDFSTTLYGLQVYPETVREILIEKPFLKFFTGKMTMMTKFDTKQNQYLELNFEFRKKKKPTLVLKKKLLQCIVKNLEEKNSEFRELHRHIGVRALPKLIFWPKDHELHFTPGVKQKWVKKQ